MTTDRARPRYCSLCGEAFEAPLSVCPHCGETWAEPLLRRDLPTTAALLSTLQRWIDVELIDAESTEQVRQEYERRLASLSGREAAPPSSEPAPQPSAAAPPPPPIPGTPAAGPTPAPASTAPTRRRPAPPRRPPRPSFDLQAWVATRQADVLLYLGAFLLVVSALTFVSLQDGELATGWRVGLLATYTVGFLGTGLFIRRWPRVQEAGPVFLAIGALFTPLNFVLIYTEVLADRDVSASAVWFGGASYSVLFYGVLFRQGFGRLYAVPAALAIHIAWAALFFTLDIPGEWFGAWWMAFAAVTIVPLARTGWLRAPALVYLAAIATLSLFFSHIVLADDTLHRGPLPTTYALLAAGFTYLGYERRGVLTAIATAIGITLAAVAALWAFGFEADWYAYPSLIVAATVVATQRRWGHLDARLTPAGWTFAGVAALTPFVLIDTYSDGAHGLVAFAASAAILTGVAAVNVTGGVFTEVWAKRLPTAWGERLIFSWLAFVMLLVAIAYAHRELGVARPDTGWSYLVVGWLVVLAMAAVARSDARAYGALLPALAVTTAVSLQRWDPYAGHDAVLLGVPAVALLLAFGWTRRWGLTLLSAGLAVASAAAVWAAADWELWTLAWVYGVAGLALFAGLASFRDYALIDDRLEERPLSAILLSWGVLLTAPATAVIALSLRAESGYDAPSTAEYQTLVAVIAAIGVLLALEGWRLRRWDVQVPALAIVAGALGAAWPALDFEIWTLGPVYAAAGIALLVVLASRRRYAEVDREALAVVVLSWGLIAASLVAATIALQLRAEAGYDPPSTIEYRALVALGGLLGVLVAAEGWRLGRWDWQVPALAIAAIAVAAAWPSFGFEPWTLGPSYAAVGLALFVALTSRRRYVEEDYDAVVIVVLSWGLPLAALAAAGTALSLRAESGFDAPLTIEYRSLIALIAAFGLLVAAEGWRIGRWAWQVVALAVLAGAVGAAWPALGLEPWSLGPVYGAAGVAMLLALNSRRSYRNTGSAAVSVLILSWALFALAPLVAANVLQTRLDERVRPAVGLVEYRALLATILLLAPVIAYEGSRIGQRSLYIAAGAVAVTALEMGIATFEPTNVQAYTVPAAAYAAGVSLLVRRSPMLIWPHLQWHELITIVGAGLLVLPQAVQGFEPGGQGWALVLLLEGALFLVLSFVLTARWLAVSGVMTVSGVAIRALWVSRDAVPYWVMLGLAGLLLLAGGFVLLLQREWWDRAREGVSDWWARHAVLAAQPADIHLLALLTALGPALAAAALPVAD